VARAPAPHSRSLTGAPNAAATSHVARPTSHVPRRTPVPNVMKLLIATRNDGKAREIREAFAGLPFQPVFPADQFLERLPEERDLEEGTSLGENAVAKARYFAKRANLPTLAEDSGLEVDALEGAP